MLSQFSWGLILSLTLLGWLPATRSPPIPVRGSAGEVSPAVTRGLAWLVTAQHADGGWGAGAHSHQETQDPHSVPTDPATTAFAALAFLRIGSFASDGAYATSVRRATEELLRTVEAAPPSGPRITDMTGSHPQAKLGNLIDTSMALLYFSRLLPRLAAEDPLTRRVTPPWRNA